MRRRVWPWWIMLFCVAVLLLVGLPRSALYSQAERTLTTILNRVFNPATDTLMGIPWAGAQGPELTPTQIFNRAFDPDNNMLRLDGGAGGGGPTGAAGGDLAGNFPNPTITTNAVGSAEIIDNAVTGTDIDESTLVLTGLIGDTALAAGAVDGGVGGEIADASITAEDLAANSVDASELVSTTVTPGAYGSATQVPTFTVDADGRLTAAANVTITGAAPTGAAGGDLAGTYPAPTIAANALGSAEVTDGSLTADDLAANSVDASELVSTTVTLGAYGSATQVATFTVDADGRLTAAANVTITGAAPSGAAGGDLTGTYPNPTITTDAVGSAEITDASIAAIDLAPNSVDTSELVSTTVTLGSYGSATQVGTFTVDADGRLTAAANVTITGAAPSGAAGGDLAGSTYPNPTLAANTVDAAELVATAVTLGSYGSATQVGTFTVDVDGRLTAAANVTVVVGSAGITDASVAAIDLAPNSVDTSELVSTAVTPGSYGSGTQSGTFTVDADGRLTAAANVTITGAAPTGAAGGDLAGTYPNPTITTDAVGSAEIVDASVAAIDLAPNSVDASELVATAVTPGAYGSASQVATLTVDADGRLTTAGQTPIAVPLSQIVGVDVVTTPAQDGDVFTYDVATTLWMPRALPTFPETTGIRTTATEIQSLRPGFLPLSGTCVLGTSSFIRLTATPAGTTCVLPDPTDTTNPGYYYIEVADDNLATLAPSGLFLLDGVNSSSRTIRGPRASFEVRWDGVTWVSTAMTSVGYGEPVLNVCSRYGGTINNSSTNSGTFVATTLSCTLPTSVLKAGTVLKTCQMWQMVTGTSAPTLVWELRANAVALARNTIIDMLENVVGNSITQCFMTMIKEDVSATTDTVTAPYVEFSGMNVSQYSNSILQPVVIATNVEVTLSMYSKWASVGTGPNTVEPLALTVEATRFVN